MPLVLLIEDDPTQRLLTGSILQKAGHHVIEAEDGDKGLEAARTNKPDLIVCDVMMPGLDGYQVVEALRKNPGLSMIPVILLTAMGSRAHMRIGMTAGADDYIAKPFIAAELREAVTALIARRKLQARQATGEYRSLLTAALDEQKQSLAQQYEKRLENELSERWSRNIDRNAELKYELATLLAVNLFDVAAHKGVEGGAQSAAVRHIYQSARDCLHLFSPRHLLPYGNDLVAVFADEAGTSSPKQRLLALRAAFGVLKATGGPSAVTAALHSGPVTLLRVDDPLHDSEVSTLTTGEAINVVSRVHGAARSAGWCVACTPGVIDGISSAVVKGKTTPASGVDAIELLSMA